MQKNQKKITEPRSENQNGREKTHFYKYLPDRDRFFFFHFATLSVTGIFTTVKSSPSNPRFCQKDRCYDAKANICNFYKKLVHNMV